MKDPARAFEAFASFQEVASLLLAESFRYAHDCANEQVAGSIFLDKADSIELGSAEAVSALSSEQGPEPTSLDGFIDMIDRLSLDVDDALSSQLFIAWNSALEEAVVSGRKLPRTEKLTSRYMVHHVILLAASVETVINRHLFRMREAGELDDGLHESIDHAELLPKMMFAFKDEIASKTLLTSNIRRLIRLRNKAVHFKATSADKVVCTPEELLRIWREVGQLFSFIPGDPTPEEMAHHMRGFIEQWLEPASGDKKLWSFDPSS